MTKLKTGESKMGTSTKIRMMQIILLITGILMGTYGWMVMHNIDMQNHDMNMDSIDHSEMSWEEHMAYMKSMAMEDKVNLFSQLNREIKGTNLADGKYKCCLDKPCTYCIEKTPGHGEGSTCLCLEDVINGVHPCGECIGEILEGHGNQYLAEYFAKAIAEKTGEYDAIAKIIEAKYGIPVAEQVV